MKKLPFIAAACIAALAACNQGQTDSSTPANTSTSNSSATVGGGGGAGAVDAEVEQQVSMAAQVIQSQVPIRQGPTTITSARAEGMELTTAMTLPVELNDQIVQQMQQQLPTQQCSNPQVAQLIQRGARFSYEITDSTGEVFEVNISSCPGGAGSM